MLKNFQISKSDKDRILSLHESVKSKHGTSDYNTLTENNIPTDDQFERKLRVFFTYLQKIQGLNELKLELEKKNSPGNQLKPYKEAVRGFRLVGWDYVPNHQLRIAIQDKLYMLINNFLHNGGYNRDFKEGPLDIIPSTKWDIEMDYIENVTEYGRYYSEALGNDLETVTNNVLEDPSRFMVNSETLDSVYGDDYLDKSIREMRPRDLFPTKEVFES